MKRSTHYLTQNRLHGRWHYSRPEHATLAGPVNRDWLTAAITLAHETRGLAHNRTYIAGRLIDAHQRGIHAFAHTAAELGLLRNRRLAHYINQAVRDDSAQAHARVTDKLTAAIAAKAKAAEAPAAEPAAVADTSKLTSEPARTTIAPTTTTPRQTSPRTPQQRDRVELEPIFGAHLLRPADTRTAPIALNLAEQTRRNQRAALAQVQQVMDIIKAAR